MRERSLRDPLLLAVAVVIDLHPDPEPMLRRMERDVVVDGGNLATYLGQLLEAPPGEGDADESDSLLRAAATVVAAAGIAELQPVLLARLARDAASQWIEGLLTRFPERLTRRLAELLRHPDQDVRCGALRVGAFCPGDVSAVIGHLADPHLPVRTAACHALGRIGTRCHRAAAAGAAPERGAAGTGGGGAGPRAALARGARRARRLPGAGHRRGGRGGSARRAGPHSRPGAGAARARARRVAEPGIRLAALRAASRVPGSRAEVVLMRALADRHAPIQAEALDLLVRRGGEKSVTTLVAMLGTADSLRFHVIRALGHCRAQSAAVRLRDLFSQCGPHEQLQIVSSLLRIAPAWLPQFLLLRLESPDLDMRRAAAQGLAESAGHEHLPVLRALAEDADWDIRHSAARGLGRLRTAETRDLLLTLARDVESVVAATARAALEQSQVRRLQRGVSPFPAADLKLLGDLIQERFGLTFEGVRQEILAARLGPRLRELHLDSPRAYYEYLRFHPQRDAEFDRLPALVTNNETYFFRETRQFEILVDHVVPGASRGAAGAAASAPLRRLQLG